VKVTKEKIENSQAFLKVEIEPTELEDGLQHAYEHLVKSTNVPGFRKGKAPRSVLERHLGKEALLEHAINEMIPDAYEKAIKEQSLEPIAQPQIEISQIEPVIFNAIVPLPATITLGDYKSIRMSPEEVKVEESSVDKVIEQLQHQNAIWEPVDRPAVFNDMVTLDIKSDIEGKAFVTRDGLQYQVEQGTTFPVPGFAEQLVGLILNQEKEFNLKLPDDYARKDIAGKQVAFKVKIKEIKQEKLPEVNEEFIKTVSSDCPDIKTLRERIFADLKTREAERVKTDFEEKLLQTLVDMSKLDYAPVMVEQETNRLLNQQLQYLQASGINVDEYLKNIKKTTEQLKEDLKPRAIKRVNQSLILGKIADQEKIEVSDGDIEVQIESLLQSYAKEKRDEYRASFNTETSKSSIKDALLIAKALERLVEIAKEPEVEKKTDNQ
jgi:trigger factor